MAITNIASEIIGMVWKIEKAVGDDVKTGEIIMVLESMKMEIPVESTLDGKITELLVREEDSVDEEQVLCKIES